MGSKKYSHEMDNWLREHVPNRPRKFAYADFRTRFGDSFDDKSIDNRITALKVRSGTQSKWLPEEDCLIREMKSDGKLWKDMIPEIEKISGNRRSVNSLKCRARVLGITEEKKGRDWTPEEDQWIQENFAEYSNYSEMADAFNKAFGTNRHWRAIQSHAVRYCGVVTGRQRFKKGMKPWCTRQVGDEHRLGTGYQQVKIADGEWIPKQQFIYEATHGKLKEGQFVIFLNRDKNDFSLENLAAVDRKIHAVMCANNWYSESRDKTMAAIKLCELNRAINSLKNGGC